ncbi:HAD family hydrolase [Sorangium sp. So ce854]|uniref:HAD family hydrolase n=1 Tax=Sorangium sp. So ce854 TaxID=3133322 RepID=UPI003F5DED93
MIKAILFDLDNCLSPADEVGRELLEPVFAAIRRENRGRLSDEALEQAFSDCWRHALDFVARAHGFSAEMLAAGWEACAHLEVRAPMRGYPDLGALAELPVLRFLVTSGFRRLQESKIRALGIERLFAGIQVDAIDEPDRKGKQGIFEEILRAHRLDPGEALVVGDNPASEIEAGNRLGIRTVQILRAGVPRGDSATYTIHGLDELKALVTRDNAGRAL